MGAEFSHLNTANVREVMACDLAQVEELYQELMESRAELIDSVNLEEEASKPGVGEEGDEEVDLDIPYAAPHDYIARVDFMIQMDELKTVFKEFQKEDISLFRDLFLRMDEMGKEEMSFKDLMILIAVLLAPDLTSAIETAFRIWDFERKELLEQKEFMRVLRNLNMLLENFGDKKLQESQMQDLVNSVYTINGKIDGVICYTDFLTVIVEHPIIQISLCVQFQGTGREKLKELLGV